MNKDDAMVNMVTAARSLVDVPFHHAGRSPYGVDCVGLLVLAAHTAGLRVYDSMQYSPIVDARSLKAHLAISCDEVCGGCTMPCDVLVLRVGTSPQHLALVTEVENDVPTMIVHAHQTVGRVVEEAYTIRWSRRLAGVWRLKESLWPR